MNHPLLRDPCAGLFMLLGTLCLLPAAWAATFDVLSGKNYQLTIQSQLEPVAINRIHSWELEVRDVQGKPVANATIQVDGGMPTHDHGLPTAPRVTKELGPGRYLLEGMKFQMGGEWEVHFLIDAAAGKESLTLDFVL